MDEEWDITWLDVWDMGSGGERVMEEDSFTF